MEYDLAGILTAVSASAAAVSTGLVAWQAKQLAAQTRISNQVAEAQAMRELSRALQTINLVFVHRPRLRSFFYSSKKVPAITSGRHRVEAVAEVVADILEDGLYAAATHGGFATENESDLSSYIQFLRAHSPALSAIVAGHPDWWPRLARALGDG